MTSSQKLILSIGLAAFLTTLFFIPCTSQLAVRKFDTSLPFWQVSHTETINFGLIGIWWGAIVLVTGGLMAMNSKK